jgi:RNA polymerase sigma-70 factor, ECF subfamily
MNKKERSSYSSLIPPPSSLLAGRAVNIRAGRRVFVCGSGEFERMLEAETGAKLFFMDAERRRGGDGHAPPAPPSGEASPEAALAEAARAGDREAFGRLYEIYSPMVHAVLLARVPYGEARDLVQDVFLTAYGKLKSLRDAERFGPWVAMIARNRAADFHRRARETEELKDDFAGGGCGAAAEASEALAIIRALPEAYRETLVMRLVEGMTGPEIAERTGLQPASVRVNLHRGMKLLRERLTAKGRDI